MDNFLGLRTIICDHTLGRTSTAWRDETKFSSLRGRCFSFGTTLGSPFVAPAVLIQLAIQIILFIGSLFARHEIRKNAKNLGEAFCVTLISPFAIASLFIRGIAGTLLHPGILLKYEKEKIIEATDVIREKNSIDVKSKANVAPQAVSPFENLPDDLHKNVITSFLSAKDLSTLAQTNQANKKRVNQSPSYKKLMQENQKLQQDVFKDYICLEHFKKLPTIHFEEFDDRVTLTLQNRKISLLGVSQTSLKKHADNFFHYFQKAFYTSTEDSLQDKNLLGRIELKAKDGSVMHGLFGHRELTTQMLKESEPTYYFDIFLPGNPIAYEESRLIGSVLEPFFPGTNRNPAIALFNYSHKSKSSNGFGSMRFTNKNEIIKTINYYFTSFSQPKKQNTTTSNTLCSLCA